MISNFEELTIRAANEGSRENIREAIRCYETGSFRAAIVSAYVSMCFDLLDKLRQLSESGDGKAKAEIDKLDKYNDQLKLGNTSVMKEILEFEKGLLDLFFNELDFFDIHQYTELKRLREDRHKCAHPTVLPSGQHYAPSAELARLHIRNTLVHVLQHPPKQGRAAIASVTSLILSPFFPEEHSAIVQRLKGSELASARPALVRGVIDEVTFGWPNSAHDLHHKSAAVNALFAVLEMYPGEGVERAKVNVEKLLARTDQDSIYLGAYLAIRVIGVGYNLSDSAATTVSAWLLKLEEHQLASLMTLALRFEKVKTAALLRTMSLTPDQMGMMFSGETPAAEVVERAVQLYLGAKNWNEANSLAAKCAIPYARFMTPVQIQMIFDAAKAGTADLIGSNALPSFIRALYENPIGKSGVDKILEESGLEHYKVPVSQLADLSI